MIEAETLIASLPGSLVDQVPFGVAALQPDSSGDCFRYAYANGRYERLADGEALTGRAFGDVWPSGEPSQDDLRRVLETGEDWWVRYLPGEGEIRSDLPARPFARVLSRFSAAGRHYVIDFVIDNEAPFADSAVESVKQAAELEALFGHDEGPIASVALLARVASMASSSLTLEKVCERTLLAMRDHIADLASAGIYVLDSEATHLRALAMFSQGEPIVSSDETLPISPSTDAGMLVLHGYQLLTHESGGRSLHGEHREDGLESSRWIDLAIERRGRLLGVLELGFKGEGTFGQDELRLYHGIAAILGNAVGNAHSYAAEARNARIAEGVSLILSASLRSRTEEDLGQECLRVLAALTESEFGLVADYVIGTMRSVAVSPEAWKASAMGSDSFRLMDRGMVPDGLWRWLVDERETLIVNEEGSHPACKGVPLGHPPVHTFMGTPLLGKHGQVFGMIGLANRPGGYGEAERLAVEALAPVIVEAIERFRAERQLAENARFADELNHIESIIHATLDFDTIAAEALRTGRDALGASSAAVSLYEPPNFRITHAIGFDDDPTDQLFPEELEPQSMLAIQSKGPVLVQDVMTDERVNARHLISYGIQAVMAIPLLFGGNAFGVAYYNFSEPRTYSEAEVRFVVRLSLSLSLAMENARLYENERTISNRLQEALLALPDVVPGVEFAHSYYPATDAARVGGDFYDIFELSYGHVGITIGDVAGKGVDAAALTSLVKNTIRAHAAERGKTPAQVLKLTNEVLYKTTPVESFVTVFFAILDCRDGRMVCANGGHTTAAVVRPDGEVVKLPVTGPLLGAFPDVELDHVVARLGLEDSLFLYTDGLTEARRGKDLYGEERLFASLARSYEQRPRRLMHRVVADMMAYSHGRLRDDLAILAVRRAEGGLQVPHQQTLDL